MQDVLKYNNTKRRPAVDTRAVVPGSWTAVWLYASSNCLLWHAVLLSNTISWQVDQLLHALIQEFDRTEHGSQISHSKCELSQYSNKSDC